MREAIATQDFGRLFFLLRKWAGVSFNQIAEACDIKSSRVCQLARGEGTISTLSKIEHIADVLRIPGHMLRLAPRPWETGTASETSPGARPSSLPRLTGTDDTPVGDDYVRAIRETSRRLVLLDNELNGLPIADMATRAFKAVHRRLGQGDYEARHERDIRSAAAELAEIAGWALFNAENLAAARRFNQEALFLARLAGDGSIELLILQNMGMVSGWVGRHREELAIARSVLESRELPPRVEAIFRAREGQGLAGTGRHEEAVRNFLRARSLLQDDPPDVAPPWSWWISEDELDRQEGRSLQESGRWEKAVPLLQRATHEPSGEPVGYRNVAAVRLLACFLELRAWREAEEVANFLAPATGETASTITLSLLEATVRRGRAVPGAPPALRESLDRVADALGEDPYVL
ncbi:tetratricopeptide repeat protein [Streptomyces sp. ST2-7A]|uniref:tetratricopeptide repeat protein n=1 Tax=Streptomyces sp. ST2-7A TaxID=2907214 RepID=UPI001F3A0420|nr:tetratricopeptide repeat protein [Streptomyces sp. ST2-7A]MCE7081872.1 tetratricopeptide repeat protein [Streptomyces sp. ST2-7A]